MAIANMKASFTSDIAKIWMIVTSCEDYEWRSDLSKIEVVEQGKRFIEYTKDGYPTEYTITVFQPYERYEFDMENDNMTGHWTGIFSMEKDKVCIDFTENITVKKLFMKPFVGMYLRKQQATYLQDLMKALGEV